MSDIAEGLIHESSRPAESEAGTRAGWIGPVSIAAVWLAYWQIAPRIHASSVGAVVVSTLIALGIIVWFTAQVARSCRSSRALLLNLFLSAVIVLPLRFMFAGRWVAPPWSLLLHVPGLPDLLFVWFAASAGACLSLVLRSANMIPPIAAVLAIVDIWTVRLGGPVQKLLESSNPMAKKLSVAMTIAMPSVSKGAAPFQPMSFVGFADFVFIACFVAAICRFIAVPGTYERTVSVIVGVLCAYMLLVLILPGAERLPALVPLAVVTVALHWRRFHYERSEAFALLYAGVFIALIVAGFWYFGRSDGKTPNPESAPYLSHPA